MEEKGRKIFGEREMWGKRGLSRLIFGQRGGGRYITIDCNTHTQKEKK
jgi:hypothetical protein